jgi:hypothetical protein
MSPTLRKLSALFLFVFIGLSACTDHDIETNLPALTTLESFGSSGYQLQVDRIGDKPILEYGIVYTSYFRGVGNHNLSPPLQIPRSSLKTRWFQV